MQMCISIKNLCFEAIIGILPEEKLKPQRIKICAKIKYRYVDSKYLDYVSVANLIVKCVQTGRYELLETALHDIARHCFQAFNNIETMKLYVEKPDIFTNCKIEMTTEVQSDVQKNGMRIGVKAKFSANEFQNHIQNNTLK